MGSQFAGVGICISLRLPAGFCSVQLLVGGLLCQIVALLLTCALLRWVRRKQADYWWYVAEECD